MNGYNPKTYIYSTLSKSEEIFWSAKPVSSALLYFELNPSPPPKKKKKTLDFTCRQYQSFENTVGNGEIARDEQFLLFPPCFLPI